MCEREIRIGERKDREKVQKKCKILPIKISTVIESATVSKFYCTFTEFFFFSHESLMRGIKIRAFPVRFPAAGTVIKTGFRCTPGQFTVNFSTKPVLSISQSTVYTVAIYLLCCVCSVPLRCSAYVQLTVQFVCESNTQFTDSTTINYSTVYLPVCTHYCTLT